MDLYSLKIKWFYYIIYYKLQISQLLNITLELSFFVPFGYRYCQYSLYNVSAAPKSNFCLRNFAIVLNNYLKITVAIEFKPIPNSK